MDERRFNHVVPIRGTPYGILVHEHYAVHVVQRMLAGTRFNDNHLEQQIDAITDVVKDATRVSMDYEEHPLLSRVKRVGWLHVGSVCCVCVAAWFASWYDWRLGCVVAALFFALYLLAHAHLQSLEENQQSVYDYGVRYPPRRRDLPRLPQEPPAPRPEQSPLASEGSTSTSVRAAE